MADLARRSEGKVVQELETLEKPVLIAIIVEQRKAIDDLRAMVDGLQKRVDELAAENTRQAETIKTQAERIDDLERRLRQNSNNSHRPPSSDPPGAFDRGRWKRRRGGKRGGQPGHEGTHRAMVPADEVDRTVVVRPYRCRCCDAVLRGEDPKPERRQVTDIPPVKPVVTEYRLHALTCPRCGSVTRASLPPGVPTGAFGPRVQALVALLSGSYRLSKRCVEQVLADCFGVDLSLGSVSNIEESVSDALQAPVEQARTYIREQAIVHVDETSWRESARRAWLWVAATPWVTAFTVHVSRGAAVAKAILGAAFGGYVVSDRYGAYSWLGRARRQICWAHLRRDFQKLAEMTEAEMKTVGETLLMLTDVLFEEWYRVRDGTITRGTFRRRIRWVRAQLHEQLLLGAGRACKAGSGLCREILKVEPSLWTFARVEGLDPTNNDAERPLRHAVLWRKGCYGTDSTRGSRFVERILTVVASLRQQKRNVLEYLTAATSAALAGVQAPSILPLAGRPLAHPS